MATLGAQTLLLILIIAVVAVMYALKVQGQETMPAAMVIASIFLLTWIIATAVATLVRAQRRHAAQQDA